MKHITIRVRRTEYELLKELEKEGRSIRAIASDAIDLYVGREKPDLIREKIREMLKTYE